MYDSNLIKMRINNKFNPYFPNKNLKSVRLFFFNFNRPEYYK